MAVTSSTGCAGNNAVGKEQESISTALNTMRWRMLISWSTKRVLKSRTRRCGPGVGAEGPGTCKQKYLEVKVCSPELNTQI